MNDEPEAPRLQDTTERSALPLPLPGSEGDPPEPEVDAATDETNAAPEVDPAFAPPAVEAAFGDAESETRPEVLIGAAFLGGVALAFILKRFGS
jgi:hypothetical protein